MKKIVLYLGVLLIWSFALQPLTAEAKKEQPDSIASDVEALIEQARWGDGQACVELANRYCEGIGVEQDFLCAMLSFMQARDFGAIYDLKVYMADVLEGSNFKLAIDGILKSADKQSEAALSISEQLIANGSSEGYTIQGALAIEQGDTLKGMELLERATDQGSSFAGVLLCLQNWRETFNPNIDRFTALADKKPACYLLLAYTYMEREESLAAHYFLKADQRGFLNKEGAQWLLGYYERSGEVQLTEEDVRRLQKLSGEALEEQGDTVITEE
ncbi:MAG: hypothetical protein J1E57_05225 [Prevotella sp.]|nr:hypothetical protein [Prevotella sp.]